MHLIKITLGQTIMEDNLILLLEDSGKKIGSPLISRLYKELEQL